jgi:CheY-like chemotaxis protein
VIISRIPEILLIEDSKDDRDLFAMALSSSGVHATLSTLFSVTEAVLRIKRLGAHAGSPLPALIVLDLAQPDGDGIALIQLIQRTLIADPVPLVVLTGSQLESHRTRCLELGIAGFHLKPTAFAELVGLVKELSRFLPRQDVPPALVATRRAGA